MAAKTPAEPSAKSNRNNRRREITGILLLAGALFAGLSVISMQAGGDPLMGPGGTLVASAFYGLFGLAGYLVMAAMVIEAIRCFRGRRLVDSLGEAMGATLLICGLSVLLYLPFAGEPVAQHGPGGLFGEWLGELTGGFIGAVGAGMAATTMLLVGVLLVTDISLSQAMVVLSWAGKHAQRAIVAGAIAGWRVARAAFPEKDDTGEKHRELDADPDEVPPGDRDQRAGPQRRATTTTRRPCPAEVEPEASDGVRVGEAQTVLEASREESKTLRGFPSPAVNAERAAVAAVVAEVAAVEQFAEAEPEAEDTEPDAAPIIAAPTPPPNAPIIVEPASVSRLRHEAALAAEAEAESESPELVERTPQEKLGFIKLGDGAFKLPGTDLLEYIPPQAPDMDKQQLYEMAERLEQAMANYGVRGKVKEIHMGPVVTMYEFAPAPGTRTGKIANLEKDLAMALEAQAVRIVAPIPGKAVVGVEVPNLTRETVYLKEILQDSCFVGAAGSKLQVALGKDIKGAPVSVNLAKMPHLLVAGTTGSGKSVAVNGMITSILYNASPEEVRFIMVDPKMLELSIYEGIPHLLLPVVTDPKKANLALRWAVDEMERRYELLAKTGVRDIASYNAKIDGEGKPAAAPEAPAKQQEDPRGAGRPRRHRAGGRPGRRLRDHRRRTATPPASWPSSRPATKICPTPPPRCSSRNRRPRRSRPRSRPSSPTSSSSSTSSPT